MGQTFIGASSWAKPSRTRSSFYPPWTNTPDQRLKHYATQFPLTEVDSSFYAFPSTRNSRLWLNSTPDGFTFNIKSFRLFSLHPTPPSAIPRAMRDRLPVRNGNFYLTDLPRELCDELWKAFARAVEVFDAKSKLGVVFFQFPPWFLPGKESYAYLATLRDKLPRFQIAVEFRTGQWLNDGNCENTLRFLQREGLSLVCVDEPQGLRSSVPPICEATSKTVVLRLYGRNRASWGNKDLPETERFEYLYPDEELNEWVPKLKHAAEKADKVYVIFKNKHEDYSVKNALRMKELLV